jgi:hypothetical protein
MKHGIAVGGQRFLVAFQGAVTEDAGTRQLHAQPIGDLVAGRFLGFILDLDDGVRIAAHELGQPGILENFDAQLLRPKLDRQGVVHPIAGCGHEWPPVKGIGFGIGAR